MRARCIAVWWGVVLLGGCASIGDLFREPDVRLDRVVLRGLGPAGGNLDLVLDIENPNPFDLRGTGLELGLDVEGSHLGDVRFSEGFAVPQGDRTTLTLPLRFELAGFASALRAALSQGEVPYEMKGQVSLETPLGPRTVAFSKAGRAPLIRPGAASPAPTSP